MKKIFLIPLMSLLTCVMAWGEEVGTFAELQTALAGSDATITLTGNITATATLAVTREVTLDLNTHTLTFSEGAFSASTGSSVTILNGTVTNTNTNDWNTVFVEGGDLTLNCNVSASRWNAICVNSGNLVVNGGNIIGSANGIKFQGGNVTINGGSISGNTGADNYWYNGIYAGTSAGNLTINGGTISGLWNGLSLDGGVTVISNATITGTNNYGIYNNGSFVMVKSATISGKSIGIYDYTTFCQYMIPNGSVNGVAFTSSLANVNTALATDGINQVYQQNALNINQASFDLQGKTLNVAYSITAGANMTIQNGTIHAFRTSANNMYGNNAVKALTISKKVVTLQDLIVKASAYGTDKAPATCVTVSGSETEASLTIEDCSFIASSESGDATALSASCGTYTDASGASVIVNNSDFSASAGQSSFGISVASGATLTFNSGNINATTTGASATGVFVQGRSTTAAATVPANRTTTLNFNGGTISAAGYAITGNGSQTNTVINITGGTIQGEWAGIYHPQEGKLVIKGNPIITGGNAIQLCAGVGMTGSITGGRFEAYGTDLRATKTGDGLITDGAALSIVNRNYPGGMPTFAINGGTFLAQHQDAILAYTWDNSQPVGSKHSAWAEATSHLSIREGIFSSDPTAYVPASGYTVTELDPTPTVYNHDEVVYSHLWQVGEESHVQSYDFTAAEVEYVEINATTGTVSDNMEGTTYTLAENQSSKKVQVAEEYTLVVAEDKQLNIGTGGLVLEDNAKLVVEPGAVVTVGTNGIINANGTENLVLETSSEKQAALLIDPDVIQNTQPLATVTIHTAARQKSANPYNYIWEYFACPVQEITDANKPTNNFDAAVQGLYAGEDHFITGVYTWGGNDWALVSSWKSLVPFKGYQLTNNSANGGVDYTFKGNLMGNGDGTYEFTTNGYGYFGNSYTAPIVISNFLGALDNSVYERTVWLYDAGADTYVSVNPLAARLGSAKYKDGTSIKEIRSLQAFILNKKADGAAATVNYRDAIWNNPRINSLAAPAPARYAAEEMQWSNIYVAANGKKEMVTLIEGTDFSNEFDNGADAGKYINNNSMNLYAATNDGKQAIVATDNLENTILSFQAGDATEYTLSFENGNENYMLRDNVTGAMVAIAEGGEYTFTQAANTTNPARFEVVAIAKVPTAIENVEEAAKATGIYTLAGQYMGRDFTVLPAGVYVVNGVKVVK